MDATKGGIHKSESLDKETPDESGNVIPGKRRSSITVHDRLSSSFQKKSFL